MRVRVFALSVCDLAHIPSTGVITLPEDDEEPREAVASGKKVVSALQQKLATDKDLMAITILSLDTLVCQNDCSGHGTCHQVGLLQPSL